MEKNLLVTHTDLDGAGCAILLRLAYIDNIDINYVSNPSEATKLLKTVKGYDTIYVADMSFDPDELSYSILNKIKLYDHHQTAERCSRYGIVDTSGIESGTSLLHKSFPCKPADTFVDLVRKYDTWIWEEENNKLPYYLNTLFQLYGMEKFVDIFVSKLRQNILTELNVLTVEEAFLVAEYELFKEREMNNATKNVHIVETSDYKFALFFGNYDFSNFAIILKKQYPDVDFVMQINPNTGAVSVRTDKTYIDLGTLMHNKFSGGGHRMAAGGKIDFIDSIIETAVQQLGMVTEITKG